MYFDGWVMLKSGIKGNADRKHAAQSFINYMSMPESAVRNMYYIGYTSVISGGDSNIVYDYLKWNYEAEDGEEDTIEYPLGYFFSGSNADTDYILTVPASQITGELSAQYPSQEVMDRSAVMQYFDSEQNSRINRMWINVRCYNIKNVPGWAWILAAAAVAVLIAMYVRKKLSNRNI